MEFRRGFSAGFPIVHAVFYAFTDAFSIIFCTGVCSRFAQCFEGFLTIALGADHMFPGLLVNRNTSSYWLLRD
jgi:hypothetical protein